MKKIVIALAFLSGFLYSENNTTIIEKSTLTKEECSKVQEKMITAIKDGEEAYQNKNEQLFKEKVSLQIQIITKFNEDKCYIYFDNTGSVKESGESLIKSLLELKNKGIQ